MKRGSQDCWTRIQACGPSEISVGASLWRCRSNLQGPLPYVLGGPGIRRQMLGEISYSVATDWSVCAPQNRRIEMIRWLLLAAVAFLVIAALQGVMASRRTKKPVEGQAPLPTLPPLLNATELENSR